MKLKYYLRGLGTGVFVTALIMTVAFEISDAKKDSLTPEETTIEVANNESKDESIKEETSEENTENLAENDEEGNKTSQEEKEDTQKASEDWENISQENEDRTDEVSDSEEDEENEEDDEDDKENEENEDYLEETEKVTKNENQDVTYIDIYVGMSSNKVSKKLEELGVVESANDFNEYLYSRHLENEINVGYFEIGYGASYEEIANLITG